MAWAAVKWAMAQQPPAMARLALLVLAAEADGAGCCTMSKAALAKATGLSPSTVLVQLKLLEAHQLIRRDSGRREDGSYDTTRIVLNMPGNNQGRPGADQGGRSPADQGGRPGDDHGVGRNLAWPGADQPWSGDDQGRPGADQPTRAMAPARGSITTISDDPLALDADSRPDASEHPGSALVLSGEAPKPSKTKPADPTPEELAAFEVFWRIFPKKVDRKDSLQVFVQHLRKRVASAEAMITGAQAYAGERAGKDPKFTKGPAAWLRAEKWNDEIVAPPPGGFLDDQVNGRRGQWSAIGIAVAGMEPEPDYFDEDVIEGTVIR